MAETVIEVAPGIFQLRVPMPNNPLGYTLSYLVTGPEGHILIDTGLRSPAGTDALRDQLVGQMGVQPGAVQLILVTHNHPDHAGLVREAKGFTGARVAMHRLDWETSPMRMAMQPGGVERIRAWYLSQGMPAEEVTEVFPHRPLPDGEKDGHPPHAGPPRERHGLEQEPDVLLEGGETFSTGAVTLEALWTPGHTPGHLCFYDRARRYLFTGDHILPIITSNVSLFVGAERDPLGEYLASVAKVKDLDVGLVLPAHEHHFEDLPGRVSLLQRHHDARLEAVLQALDGEPQTAYEVATRVPWDVGSWDEMDAGLRRAAVGETLSHLEHLRRQGKVTVQGGTSLVLYASES
ncbi:MAG: MBL fold metallo-hydrolase [Chloroflexi bacterium]|nr:MBL fold metallo-hydrolase [Chloroflexota bacterium]